MTKIVVDSTCDLPAEIMKTYDIQSLPLKVLINGKEFLDKVTIQVDEVYQAMRQGILPKTSLPNPMDIYCIFENHCKNGNDFIYLAFSSALSGTCQLASAVMDELKIKFPTIRMRTVDTKSGSTATGLIALQAARLSQAGESFDTIVSQAEKLVNHVEHLFTISDLNWLVKGGRVSKSAGMLGSILSIKPILQVNSGKLEVIGKARGRKNALNTVVDLMEERIRNFPDQIIGLSYADDYGIAEELYGMIENRLGMKVGIVNKIGSVLGIHVGIGAVGVFFFNQKPDLYMN